MPKNQKYYLDEKLIILMEECRNRGLSYAAIFSRIHSGMNVKEAFEKPVQQHSKYSMLKKKCKELGVNFGTVKSRLKRGLSEEEALKPISKKPKIKKERQLVFMLDGQYINLTEECRKRNLKYDPVRQRIKHGMSVEEALEKKERKLVHMVDGQYINLTEECRKRSMKYGAVAQRIKRGMSVKEALEKPIEIKGKKNKENSSLIDEIMAA